MQSISEAMAKVTQMLSDGSKTSVGEMNTPTQSSNPESTSQQQLTASRRESQKLALCDSVEHQDKLDEMIGASLALQKLYGRDVASTGTVIALFHRVLAKYPGEKAIKAFATWMERSQEFPTPSDIIGLIKRNGKAPLKESDVIAVRKKDAELRNPDDWALLREWEKQQQESWESDYRDEEKELWKDREIIRLRAEVKELRQENLRAWEEVKKLRLKAEAPKPLEKAEDKIQRTIEAMKLNGAKPEDIEAFATEYGVAL